MKGAHSPWVLPVLGWWRQHAGWQPQRQPRRCPGCPGSGSQSPACLRGRSLWPLLAVLSAGEPLSSLGVSLGSLPRFPFNADASMVVIAGSFCNSAASTWSCQGAGLGLCNTQDSIRRAPQPPGIPGWYWDQQLSSKLGIGLFVQ